jgi:hypothetical protein
MPLAWPLPWDEWLSFLFRGGRYIVGGMGSLSTHERSPAPNNRKATAADGRGLEPIVLGWEIRAEAGLVGVT